MNRRRTSFLLLAGVAGAVTLVLIGSPFRHVSAGEADHIKTRFTAPLIGKVQVDTFNFEPFAFTGYVSVLAEVTSHPGGVTIDLIFDPSQVTGSFKSTKYHAVGAQPWHFKTSGKLPVDLTFVNSFRFVGTSADADPRSEVMSVPTEAMVSADGSVSVSFKISGG
jgi:hypothetical protein